MSTAAALIVMLSNQGYWFGGQAGTIGVSWAVSGPIPGAVLAWELKVDGVRLAADRVGLGGGETTTQLTVTVPEVRVPTRMGWHYRLLAREGGDLLCEGGEVIRAYPYGLPAGADRAWKDKAVLTWDEPDGLGLLLTEAGIAHKRIDEASDLQLTRGELVLVGPDRLAEGSSDQESLLGLARTGAGVLVFAQTKVDVLFGARLAHRRGPASLEWRESHPLLSGFDADDLRSLTTTQSELRAIQLPADAPVLEIGYWPREVPGEHPVPIDALLSVQTVGAGRIVLCQAPLGRWKKDPRSQLLLANALQYLSTRPEPTLPPSRRRVIRAVAPTSSPTITIPPGGRP